MQENNELQQKLKATTTKGKISARPTIDFNTLKELGINEDQFAQAFDKLCKRWWDKAKLVSDTSGGMLVTATLASHLNEPVIMSMIVDDVDVFKKNYTENAGDIFCLEFSCLCGAEKIINHFFLGEDDKKMCLKLSENAIGYALSSGNTSLAFSLAENALQLGKTDPGQVALYSFGKFEPAIAIADMFSTKKTFEANSKHVHDSTVPRPNKTLGSLKDPLN